MLAGLALIGRARGVRFGVDQQQGGCGATAPESRKEGGKRGRARATEQSLHACWQMLNLALPKCSGDLPAAPCPLPPGPLHLSSLSSGS